MQVFYLMSLLHGKSAELSQWTKIVLGAEFIHYFYYYMAVNACERMGVKKNRI